MGTQKLFASREELAETYTKLGSLASVAEHYGVSKKLILVRMKHFGIGRRKPVDWKTIHTLIKEGKSSKAIGLALGISATRVCQIARNRGVAVCDPYHSGFVSHNGYRLVRSAGHPAADSKGYVCEHRIIAERSLGRFLSKDEVAHHINGIKSDNRPENIEVMSIFAHKSLHRKRRDCGRLVGGPACKSRPFVEVSAGIGQPTTSSR